MRQVRKTNCGSAETDHQRSVDSRLYRLAVIAIAVMVLMSAGAMARSPVDQTDLGKSRISLNKGVPAHGAAAHRANDMLLTVANNGTIGRNFTPAGDYDFFTGDPLESCLYPADSSGSYLFAGALWIGAIVGDDTLVSFGADGWQQAAEMFPDEAPFGYMVHRDTADLDAVSDEDFTAIYTDTTTDGVMADYFGRPHMPLDVKVTRNSYVWSAADAEDIVFLHYLIEYIGADSLQETYIGLMVDADVLDLSETGPAGSTDDISGFVQSAQFPHCDCSYTDDVNLAWIGDNDGDPTAGEWNATSVRHVTGVTLVSAPIDDAKISYNWWVSNGNPALDFGPRMLANYRDYQTGGTGTPEGDANKYFVLSNGEVDYDQYFTSSVNGQSFPLWEDPPEAIEDDVTDGYDTRFLISVGPFDLYPGQTLPLVFAYVGGTDLHQDPSNLSNLPDQPDQYRDNLSLVDLLNNARSASWIYDNPGVDTDSDGYAGEYFICNDDTLWVEGDGVPDWQPGHGPECELPGDFNHDGALELGDVLDMVAYMFLGGDPPPVIEEVDVDQDGQVTIVDLINLVFYMFLQGPDLPGCGELAAHTASRPAMSSATAIEYAFDGDATTLSLVSDHMIAGIEMGLISEAHGTIEDLTAPGMKMFNSAVGDRHRFGWLAPEGGTYFEPGQHQLLRVQGRCYPSEALLSDMDGRLIRATLSKSGEEASLPTGFSLSQNYPNPFNPTTEIRFSLAAASPVTLEVYNTLGQLVETLVDDDLEAGEHTFQWNTPGLASGVYYYRLQVDEFAETRKMLLMK